MAPIPAEDGGGDAGGARGGGGGAPPKPQKEAPNVAALKPEAGFAQMQGVRPNKLVPVFGQVHTAAGADIAKARAEQKANPPKQMSTGAAAVQGAKDTKAANGKGAKGAAGAAGAGEGKGPAKDASDKPIKGEVPGGEAAKQAQQGKAAAQQKSAGEVIASAARSFVSWFGSWTGGGTSGGDAGAAKMSDAETKHLSGSLDRMPTTASDISTDTGPAPALAMKGEAKSTSDKERAALETKTTQLESQGRADSRVPMGEDHIETSVPAEELTARSVAGGAQPEVAMPTVAGAASSEEAGIVAQEEHGAEIDAALSKAGADVTAERGKHAKDEEKARADADQQVRDLKTKADADQSAARAAAKAESEKARGEWQAEIDKKGADARKQADKKIADGMAQVSAEEAKANTEANQHIEEGHRKAQQEKQKGEQEAADAKAKGKRKSSGFFGWLSSKAKSFFDGIKKAISAAIDAARRAVKAVIDAAKKLAMAAIELARKAIVATIKAIGKALIAISDVLLAAFPELKAKFQGLIKKAVDKAVDTVNRLAEGLKKAVQKALDLLGAALDKALGLLEKGLHAIVDGVAAVVDGFIKAAEAVVKALGTWARLLKHIASGPAAWLGKLGAAVVDGIKNHLWSAFKTAVLEWFKSKVMELLGVAGMILTILLEGGITTDDIIKMALDALIVAIPAALVAILIEKLVAMIVPAAGALMAIIEGLQAAWGTISRIIAAFDAFMAFLMAVQSGAAGPLFATALASAAVVLLDFVANWLLKKLRGPARKVGVRLEGMAAKFKGRGKGKGPKGSKAKPGTKPSKQKHDDHDGSHGKPKQKHDDHDSPHGKPKQKHDDHDGPHGKPKQKPNKDDRSKAKSREDKEAKKKEDAQRRLDRARAALRRYLKRARTKAQVQGKLAALKARYKLVELSLKISGKRAEIHGRVNPEFIEYAAAEIIVHNDELTPQAETEGLVTFFRSMSLGELKKLVESGRLTTKKNDQGKATSEMMLAEQNYFEGSGKDLGQGYSTDLIERKGNKHSGKKGWDYAVLVKIEILSSVKPDVLLNPATTRLHSTTAENPDVLDKHGVDRTNITTPVGSGETGVVMLKVESNRGTATPKAGGGYDLQKVLNYSIRTSDPEGLLAGDPLAELNKKIYRITLIGGAVGRKEIQFL
ncbi:MAG TPA: hypothetical protein VN253_13870 [Kofleriaceae bacterium]|nr:hypothetical protein [Kofleriaceae bacterium]